MRHPICFLNCAAPNPRNGRPCVLPCYDHTHHEDENGEKWEAPPGPNSRSEYNKRREAGCE